MLIFFLVILIHELGHIITSLLYNWKIKKISFGICGGFILYDDKIDKPFKEEFLIAISGFLFQSLFYLFSYFLYKNNIIGAKQMFLIEKYHYSILFFNMLPILPLDGSKIINVLLNLFIPYKKSLLVSSFISFVSIVLVFISFFILNIKIEYSYIMIFFFLIKKIIIFYKDIPYLFNRFLFERYSNPIKSRKKRVIKGYHLDFLKRQITHEFLIGKKRYQEKEILSKVFD